MAIVTQNPWEYEQFILTFQKPGMGVNECVKEYGRSTAPNMYSECAVMLEYKGPRYVADMLSALFPINKTDTAILDVGAGTGLVGQQLYDHGFRNITAHDGAEAMVETCRKTGIYSDFVCCLVGDGHKFPVADGTYDALTCSGGTCENHLPPSSQAELARVIKPGGFFVNAYRAKMPEIEYGQQWREESQRLEDEGKWVLYGQLNFRKYNLFADGVVDIYQVQH